MKLVKRLFGVVNPAQAQSAFASSPAVDPEKLIAQGQPMEDRGEYEAAVACYQAAIEAAPGSPRAYMNLSNALQRLERMAEAVSAQRKAVECAPDYAPARFNLGLLLHNLGEDAAAEVELLEALRLQPNMDKAALVLADLYETDNRFDEAEANFKHAVSINALHPGTLLNYGMFCFRRGRFDESIELFQSAKAIEPGFRDVESSILFSLNFRQNLDATTIAKEHTRVGAAIQQVAGPRFATWGNSRDPERRLRVGYVSGDFLHHPVALFLKPILEGHDKSNIETFCYSNYPLRNPVGQSLRERSDHWREIHALGDDDVVTQIRDDRIDILVDLSGHTARHRLPVFARQPAPVQVTWLGYLNTTGLPGIRYRICDWNTDPVGFEQYSSEQLVRMPYSQWCYVPWSSPEVVESPHPLQPDRIIFGSFNQYRKISEACLFLWAQILKRIPNAHLLVMDVPQAATRKAFLERVAGLGIDPARTTVRGREIIVQYFNTIANVDIALDTFPYNGATTTLDTLWSGVPLIALKGDRGISRGSYSILKTIAADDLIAESPDEYVEKNVRLAINHGRRRELRTSLRRRLQASPAMDVPRFVADLESRYREMWQHWCARTAS